MLLGSVIRYALKVALDIEEWETWSDSPFAFNGFPKNHRTIAQVVIYHDYKEIFIYTKGLTHSSIFEELTEFGPYAVYPTATYEDEEEKFRVKEKNTDGLLIKLHWY